MGLGGASVIPYYHDIFDRRCRICYCQRRWRDIVITCRHVHLRIFWNLFPDCYCAYVVLSVFAQSRITSLLEICWPFSNHWLNTENHDKTRRNNHPVVLMLSSNFTLTVGLQLENISRQIVQRGACKETRLIFCFQRTNISKDLLTL